MTMRNILPARQSSSAYRRESGHYLVELDLRDVRQLFNSLDPAPFLEKDLDNAAEEYIVDAVRELGLRRHAKLMIHVPASGLAGENAHSIAEAIHHYFIYRARHAGDDLRQMLGRGLISLLIGLAFLFVCLWSRQLLGDVPQQSSKQILSEGLLIMGWVAMWRPIEIFLYEWWPILRRRSVFRYIAVMPIQLRVKPAHDASPSKIASRSSPQ